MKEKIELIGYLVVIAACLYGCFWFSRFISKKMGGGVSGRNIKIIERVAFGQDKAIAICNICGLYYLIGITNNSIKILTQLDEKHFENTPQDEIQPNFAQMLNFFKTKNSQKPDDKDIKQ